jgi:hypothetical protein
MVEAMVVEAWGWRGTVQAMTDELDVFLRAHASDTTLAAVLYAGGEALWRQLHPVPPADRSWGRFLVAMGEVAAERLGDDAAAALWFRRCLEAEPVHRDAEACVAAGYGQGVLWERSGDPGRALPAYRAAAAEGFRCGTIVPATLRAAVAAVRLGFQRAQALGEADAALAKQAWLGWTWLHLHDPAVLDPGLVEELARQMCAFLLPEDDPTALAGRWRGWPPHALGIWRDADPGCLVALYGCAAAASRRFGANLAEADGYGLLAVAATTAAAGREQALEYSDK